MSMKVKFSSLQVLDNYGKGYADGEEKGFNDGLKTGNEQGYNSALERLETTDITANGTYTPNDIGFKKVVVNVPDLNGDYQTGYNDGYDKGNTDGYTNGYEQGNTDGFNSGYTQGESVGTENGYNNALSKLDELTITQNGEYTPTDDKIGFSKVNVNIVDENGSYVDGLAVGSQKMKDRASGLQYSLTAQDLDGITKIGGSAFKGDEKLSNIELPNTIISIGNDAFRSTYFSNLIIPNSVKTVGTYSFYSSQFKNVTFGTGIESIGFGAFSMCYGKPTITFLGTTPPTIETNTFSASYLKQIIVPKGCAEVYKSATNWSSFADFIVESET